MDQKMLKIYEGLFTIEEMLTEVVVEAANVAKLADQSNASFVSEALRENLLSQLGGFLDKSLPRVIENLDRSPSERLSESEPQEEQEEYVETGNPSYDSMFNNLLESSKQNAGRKFEFKLDQEVKQEEIEQTPNPLLEKDRGRAPIQPMDREKVEFDGMENWRSVLNEGSGGGPAQDAGDMVNTLMNMSESEMDMGGMRPSANPPQTMNKSMTTDDGEDIDPSIMGALAGM